MEQFFLHNNLERKMSKEFEMSMFAEIKFFVGLQIQHKKMVST